MAYISKSGNTSTDGKMGPETARSKQREDIVDMVEDDRGQSKQESDAVKSWAG